MNVACSHCPAKYAVPDDKVRGKKVRITCKRCGTAIVVDGTGALPAGATPDSTAAPTSSEAQAISAPSVSSAGAAAAGPPAVPAGAAAPADATAPSSPGAEPAVGGDKAQQRTRAKTMVGGLQASANSAPGAPGGAPATAAAAAPAPGAVPRAPAPAATAAPAAQHPAAPGPAAPAPLVKAPRPAAPAAAQASPVAKPAAAAPRGVPAAPETKPETRWSVAVTEDDHRDLTAREIGDLYASGLIDASTFLWRSGMPDWLTPFELPEIAAELGRRGFEPPSEEDEDDRPSGTWREPGKWNSPRAAAPAEDDVTMAMDARRARALMDATARDPSASPTMKPPPAPAPTPEPPAPTPLWTAEAAPYTPGPVAQVRSGTVDEVSMALSDILAPVAPVDRPIFPDVEGRGDAAKAPGSVELESSPASSQTSNIALPLVAPKSDAPPPMAEVAPVDRHALGASPRAAVTPARASRARGDLFSKEAQESRDGSARTRLPSISTEVEPPTPHEPMDPTPGPRPRPRLVTPPHGTAPAPETGLTGARNDSSVLFSLDALAAKGRPKAPSQPRLDEEALLLGKRADRASDEPPPPSLAKLQNDALYKTMTMAVPDLSAPVASSRPRGAAPSTPSPSGRPSSPAAADDGDLRLPTRSSGGAGLWIALGLGALLAGGAAAYFLFYPQYFQAPAPVAAPTETAAPAATAVAPEVPAVTPPTTAAPAAAPAEIAAPPAEPTPAPAASTGPAKPAAGATVPLPVRPAPGPAKPTGAAPEPKPAEPAPAPAPEPEPAPAAEPAAPEGPPFDKAAASEALAAAASTAAAQCASQEGTHGNGKVTVTFVNSGRATNALVSGDFAGSALGGCVAKVFRGAQVPAFSGDVVKVTKGLSIP